MLLALLSKVKLKEKKKRKKKEIISHLATYFKVENQRQTINKVIVERKKKHAEDRATKQ